MFLESVMIIGVAGLAVGYRAHRSVRALVRARGLAWWRTQILPLAMSLPALAASTLLAYPLDPSTRVLGLPFPIAAFEIHRGVWLNFVGPLSLVTFLLNAGFMFLLPQLLVLTKLRRDG